MALCYFVANGSEEPQFGWTDGERVVALAGAGGPSSLAAALQLSIGDLVDALRRARDGVGAGTVWTGRSAGADR